MLSLYAILYNAKEKIIVPYLLQRHTDRVVLSK